MFYLIEGNAKHETYFKAAFIQSLPGWDHGALTLILTPSDMINKEGNTELNNFNLPSHHSVFDRVIFMKEGVGHDKKSTVLFEKAPR